MAKKGFMNSAMKFATGDDDSRVEGTSGPLLPFRLLVVTPLVPSGSANAGAAPPEHPIRLDLEDPNLLFTKVRPHLSIEIPNVLERGRPLKIDLAPLALKSFRPDGLLSEVPLLRSLFDGRILLDRLRSGELSGSQALAQLQRLWGGSPFAAEVLGQPATTTPALDPIRPAAKPATQLTGGGLEALLDLVDLPDSAQQTADEPQRAEGGDDRIAAIIRDVAFLAKSPAGRGKTGIPMVEEAIGVELGAILQHPEVRRLEQSYRSLHFLGERARRVPGVLIDVLGIPADGAVSGLRRILGTPQEIPFTLVLVDIEIDGSARSLNELLAIAEVAEAACCPAFVNGTADLLGVAELSKIDKLDSKRNLFSAKERAPFRATVHKPALRWATIALNGVLLRGPHDKQSSRVREAEIQELPRSEEAFVWMPPAYAIAAATLASFKDTGWPGRITGARYGEIGNLPVREIDQDGVNIAIPTQTFMSTESQRELSRIGILALASAPNSDAAYIHAAPTAYVPPEKQSYDSISTLPEQRPPAISLVDQLFVARLVQFAGALCRKLPREVDSREAQEILAAATAQLFENAPPAGPTLSVRVTREADGPVANFEISPRRFVGVSLEEFTFQMPIG